MFLGHCHEYCEDFASAEQEFRNALAIFRRIYGGNPHPHATWALQSLVAVLDKQFKDTDADAVVDEFMSGWGMPDYWFPGGNQVLMGRGIACMHRGDYVDAERLFRHALAICRRNKHNSFDPDTLLCQFYVGVALHLQGHPELARAEVRKVLPVLRITAHRPDADPNMFSNYSVALLIGSSNSPGDLQGAISVARKGLNLADHSRDTDRPYLLTLIALAHRMRDERDQAIALLREANRIMPPRIHISRRLVATSLVDCLKEAGDRQAAEDVLRDSLDKLKAAHPRATPR